VDLAVSASGTLTATGLLTDATVTDTRNTLPGWSVLGQESVFTGSGTATGFSIPADDLGWVPIAIDPLTGGATLGPPVAPGTSPGGLGDTAAVLAEAAAGSGLGVNTLSADLTLNIPAGTRAGQYTGSFTITYLEVGEQGNSVVTEASDFRRGSVGDFQSHSAEKDLQLNDAEHAARRPPTGARVA
jgi:hypothetical protein